MSRKYPSAPVVAVSALVWEAGRLVLVQRAGEPARGQWSFPGGVLRLGESLSQGVAREVWEETGLTVELGEVVEVTENIVRDDLGRVAYHYVLVDYWARPCLGALRAASDASQVAWVEWEEAQAYDLTPGTRRLLERHRGERPQWK